MVLVLTKRQIGLTASTNVLAAWDRYLPHRNGIPTVGVPVTHIEKWAHKSAGLGMTTGLAFQVEAGHKLSRELTGIVP